MASATAPSNVGELVREWRERRRLTQLELALDAGVSARRLSFVETGRSKPGREMLLRVLDRLEVPFREQNRILLAAGHAGYPVPEPERDLAAPVGGRELLGPVKMRTADGGELSFSACSRHSTLRSR